MTDPSPSHTIRPFEARDTDQVVRLWNACLPYDPIARGKLLALTHLPDYESEGTWVAEAEDRIVGFIPALVRQGRAEASGWILGLALDRDILGTDVGDRLLDAATAYLRARGKTVVEVGNFGPFCFYPHTDLRHRIVLDFLEQRGFERQRELVDIRRSLVDLQTLDWIVEAEQALAQAGIRFDYCDPPYHNSLLSLLRVYFWENWIVKARRYVEQGGDPRDRIVALRDDPAGNPQVAGYVSLRVDASTGYIEQTGVLPSLRGRRLGSVLVFKALHEMVQRGATELEIVWCPYGFYRIVEGEVTRRRVQLRKSLLL